VRWAVAAGYVGAGMLLAGGLMGRSDPRVLRRIGLVPSERTTPLAWVGRRLGMPSARARIERRLDPEAGSREVDRVLGRKVVAAAVGGASAILVSPAAPVAPPLVVLLGSAGWRLPDLVLARRARARRRRAEAAIPELLDLVAVSVTAGLTPRLALDRAGRALTTGTLASELEDARRSVALGRSWSAALRRTADRLDLRDMRRLSSTLERSARLGAPVAERLRGLAREVRAERRSRQEERARRAPVAMLFPLVFLILPAFVLAAVVPTILVATHGIR
jgi:Flp pilus assembly protein TadB